MKSLFLLLALCSLPSAAFAQGTTNYPTLVDDGGSLPVAVDDKVATLTVGLTSSASTATVNSTGGFPAKGILFIDREQIGYTGTTGTTFTGLMRGFAGTTARPHSVNFTIRSVILSPHINGTRGAAIELEKKVGIGASDASGATTGYVLTKQSDGSTAWLAPGSGGAPTVSSVFSRTGAVVAATNDYTWAQIDKSSSSLADLATRSFSSLTGTPTTVGGYGISDAVPTSRTVNGHALSANVAVTPTDLGLVIGTDVQAFNAVLTTWAGLTPSSFFQTLIDDANASAARSTLGLGTLATQNGSFSGTSSGTNTGDQTSVSGNAGTATALATGRTISISGDLIYTSPSFDGSGNVTAAGTLANTAVTPGTYTLATITVNSKGVITNASNGSGGGGGDLVSTNNLSDVVNASTARTNLGLAIGTNVEAHDADLTAFAGLSPSNDDIVQRKAGAWTNRTIAQFKSDLSLSGTNTGDQTLGSLGAAASGANTDITSILLNQTGLVIKGVSSNALTIKPNETLSAARTLNLIVNDVSRTIDLSGNLTVSGAATVSGTNTGDQTLGSLGAAASGANTDITSVLLNQTGLVVKGASSNALTIKPNETLSVGRTLNIVTGDASRTLTFTADASVGGTNTGDQDLSGLVPTTRTVNGHALSANVSITPTDLSLIIGTDVEAHDADLTAIAGLSPTNDDVIQRKSGAWTNRTMAQVKTDLALAKGDVGLGSVDNTSDAGKPVSTAQQTALDLKANLASPTLTGTPAAPTAAVDTNTTQIATTAFVINQTYVRTLKATNCTLDGNCATQANTTGTAGNIDTASGTSGTSKLKFGSTYTLAANYLGPGKVIEVCGTFDVTHSSSPPNGTLGLELGSTSVFSAGAFGPSASITARGYRQCWEVHGTAAPGASVSVEASGMVLSPTSGAAVLNSVAQPVGGIATNGTLVISLAYTWAANTAGNSVVLRSFTVKGLN